MAGLGRCISSISLCSFPRCRLVILRPKMTVILSGWPMVRLASSRRSPRLSRAARRRKMRLSQYSTCEKNSRCWQPACSRSREVKKGVRWVSHFWPQVTRSRGLSELASSCRRSGAAHFKKALASCLNPTSFAQAVGQPMVLVEADAGGERKVGADAHEHSSPVPVIDVKVVLNDPALRELEVPSVRELVADGSHDAGGFASFEDDHDCIGLGPFEIRVDEFVTTAFRRLHDRNVALGGPLVHPALKLVDDAAQGIPRHRVELAICVEEADDPLWLLERLDQPVQQDAVETTIMPVDAVLVVRVEGIHDRLPTAVPAAGS